MKMSTRDRWLLAILPSILLMIGYQYTKAPKLNTAIKSLQEQLKEPGPANTGQEMAALSAESDKTQDAMEREQERQKAIGRGGPQAAVPTEWLQPNRARSLQDLSRLCEESGVTLLGTSLQNGEGKALLPPLDSLAKTLTEKHGLPAPQLWKLEISATYVKLAQLLKRLSNADRFMLPVQVDMGVDEAEGDELKWTVVLWI